jgi:hypothetical protein
MKQFQEQKDSMGRIEPKARPKVKLPMEEINQRKNQR